MVTKDNEKATLQRKVAVQTKELTKLYARLTQQKESIRKLCAIRDEARLLLMYMKGMHTQSRNSPLVQFTLLEKELLGWHEANEDTK